MFFVLLWSEYVILGQQPTAMIEWNRNEIYLSVNSFDSTNIWDCQFFCEYSCQSSHIAWCVGWYDTYFDGNVTWFIRILQCATNSKFKVNNKIGITRDNIQIEINSMIEIGQPNTYSINCKHSSIRIICFILTQLNEKGNLMHKKQKRKKLNYYIDDKSGITIQMECKVYIIHIYIYIYLYSYCVCDTKQKPKYGTINWR